MEALRYTPAGLSHHALRIRHISEQTEAGNPRRVECELPAVALGDVALELRELGIGDRVNAEGFLAKKSQHSTQLVLHLNQIRLIEKG